MAGLRPGHPVSTPQSRCTDGLDGRLKGGHDEWGNALQREDGGLLSMTMAVTARRTRKQKRAALILSGLALLGIAAGLVLYALRDTIVFFYTPSEITEKNVSPGKL